MNFFLQNKTMVRLVLLGVALVSLIPVTGEEAGCDYNLMHFKVGHSFYNGCEECKCNEFGEIECTEGTICCLFANKKGKTDRAYVNETYFDGCNSCICFENGPACTRKFCPDKCVYKNWDLAPGYAKEGKVYAYDEEAGCPKECRCCTLMEGQATLKCSKHCIYY